MTLFANLFKAAPIVAGLAILVGGMIAIILYSFGKKKAAEIFGIVAIGGVGTLMVIGIANLLVFVPEFAKSGSDCLSEIFTGDIMNCLQIGGSLPTPIPPPG